MYHLLENMVYWSASVYCGETVLIKERDRYAFYAGKLLMGADGRELQESELCGVCLARRPRHPKEKEVRR